MTVAPNVASIPQWANGKKGWLLLLAILIVGLYIAADALTVNNQKAILLFECDGDEPDDWDDRWNLLGKNSSHDQDESGGYLTGYNRSYNTTTMAENVPGEVSRVSMWAIIRDITAIDDDAPIYHHPVAYALVFGDSWLALSGRIGVNYSSLPMYYAFMVIDSNNVIVGVAERGYLIKTSSVEISTDVEEWFHITIKLEGNCIQGFTGLNSTEKVCNDEGFPRERIAIEMNSYNRLDNMTVEGYKESGIVRSASVMGFTSMTFPGWLLMLGTGLSMLLALFLAVSLKEYPMSKFMRGWCILVFIWSVVLVLIFLRIIVL